jgi:proteasome lid subunit RPN8/RPN11
MPRAMIMTGVTTMMTEAAVVLGPKGQALYWHLPPNRNTVTLPDSQTLWEVYWKNREIMVGQAHSHPGYGWPGPSYEDITTYDACERGLGKRYTWWIASMDRLVTVTWDGPGSTDYRVDRVTEEPSWVEELRRLSQQPTSDEERQS